ncbi:MAG TPA: sialidase family protein, partial [Gemmatimonadales bacterium]|nr:sialidase family protein [Gemmatimonadales bacterium]
MPSEFTRPRVLARAMTLPIFIAACGGDDPNGPPEGEAGQNARPVVVISAPAPASSFALGAMITFSGSAQDTEDGAIPAAGLLWYLGDPAEGHQIGTGATFSTDTLSSGARVVSLVARDSDGATDTAQVSFTIESAAVTASETHFGQGMRTLIAHGGRFYHAYASNASGDYDIYLRTSADGVTWTNGTPVSGIQPGNQFSAQVAAWGTGSGNVAVSWKDMGPAHPQLMVAVSTDGGLTFNAPVQVSDHADNSQLVGGIAADGTGTLYASWTRQYSGDRWDDTWFSRSTNGGATWSTPVVAFDGDHYSFDTDIVAAPGGKVWIVIVDDQSFKTNLMVRRSTDGGTSWATSQITSYTQTGKMAVHPSLALAPDGTLHALWQDIQVRYNGPARVVTSRSGDDGATWSAAVPVSDEVVISNAQGHDNRIAPSLSIGPDGTLHAAWADDRSAPGSNFDIYHDRSTDGGATWGTDALVNDMPAINEQIHAAVAA